MLPQIDLSNLPASCGVYIMEDINSKIIYVGKAVNIKTRVQSYFRPSNPDPKARLLAQAAREVKYIVTATEVEALVLENNLIKQHSPRYNIKLKDSKTYPYLKLTKQEEFPRLFFTRRLIKDGAKYYGPYLPVSAARQLLEIIRMVWHLRQCKRVLPRDIGQGRPCLNYHIGKCKAPCQGYITKEEYAKITADVALFLAGGYDAIIRDMRKQMNEAADALEFEKAAQYRDNIEVLRVLGEAQRADDKSAAACRDYIAFAKNSEDALFYVFFMRGGKITGQEHFLIETDMVYDGGGADTAVPEEFMAAFIKQFYQNAVFIPPEVITQTPPLDQEAIEAYLSELKKAAVRIKTPMRGEKLKLIQLAAQNAALVLQRKDEKERREAVKTKTALDEIAAALELNVPLARIEAFDISNTGGVLNTGSMVVFINGKAAPKEYRKFRLQQPAANDCACIEEVITRRFTRYLNTEPITAETNENSGKNAAAAGFAACPDLVFIDGGKAQVSSARRTMSHTLGEEPAPVCGIVKDDAHRTRALFYNEKEIILPPKSEGFMLITRIQDEMHRFAIDYHKKLRSSNMIKSLLDDVPGIGPARRAALFAHFGSIENIAAASIEELAQVKGMNRAAAKAVKERLNSPV